MKFVIVFAALIALAVAAPSDPSATVLRFDSNVGADSYKFSVATSDGFNQEEAGELNNKDTDHEAIVVKGSYNYIADDGKTYTVNYIADENGFQPTGDHLPVNGIHQ